MKKLISLFTTLVLCMSIAMPTFAAENDFVPSITYKPNPDIVGVLNEAGEEFIGVIRDAVGKVMEYVDSEYLDVTPVADIWDEAKEVPEHIKEMLQDVYDSLSKGEIKIPYEEYGEGLSAANMVIRDLFDVRFSNEEYQKMLEEEGVAFEITFDLGIVPDAEIIAMTMDESTRQWSLIEKTVNNGDGTVTCTFEHFCPVVFAMPVAPASAPIDAVSGINYLPWIAVLVLAVGGILFIVFKKKK